MQNSLGSEELGSMVRDIVAAPASEEVDSVSTFLDTLSSLTTDKDKQTMIRQMLVATEIDISRMRNELEFELLASLGLVRETFGKIAIRKGTHALYRQSNYNLLREETEGYSKLITEYFTTVNNEPPSQEVVSETYQRVNALIGAFDLDIGRVLDVTLDVFANLLVKNGKFFVKLLRSSAWWPELRGFDGIEWEEPEVPILPNWVLPTSPLWYSSVQEIEEQNARREQRDRKFWERVGELGERAGIQAFFELGARPIVSNNRQPDQTLPKKGEPLSKQQIARKWADEWIAETGTLPPSGNDIAAQLLGFKLRFYASDARDASDFLPDNLMHMAALLIKIGFISILDLYPHLYPLEEDMSAHKEKLLKAKKEKETKERGSVVNALTMAGALPDDGPHGLPAVNRLRDLGSKSESERSTPAKSDDATEKKSTLPEPADQKYQLLKSLLCIGALPEALFILGRHPWLLEVYPDLLELLFRLGHHSLSKVYEATKPAFTKDMPVVAKGAGARSLSRPSDFIPRRTLRWSKPDSRDAGDGIDYKFYWEEWADNVPVCQEANDVIKLCTSLLGLAGPECGQDTVLLTKIVRVGRKSLADDRSDANRKRWADFSATFIAPALSYTGRNPGVIHEVWSLFAEFDTATRYTIYQQWFTSTKPASIRSAFEQVRIDTNHVLSRVTTQNTKEYGRKIAKISYASPSIVFQLTLKRLINYPNMIDTLVECVKYLTLLGYDCLIWTIVNFLLRPEKGDTQDNGMLSAPWLKNIASFVGRALQKNSLIDPTPILQFTAHQMLQPEGELYMQDVFEQIVKQMGGVSSIGQVSDLMVYALGAGPVLRHFTLAHHFSDDRSRVGGPARRLVKCLKDTGLAPQILIALAQQVGAYIYREDQQDVPDKVVLFNLDKMRSNLLQYLEFLRTWMPVEIFDSAVPGVLDMMAEYRVDPAIAFTIARTSITRKFNASRKERQIDPPDAKKQTNGEAMDGVEDTSKVNGTTDTPDAEKQEKMTDVEMQEAPEADADESSSQPELKSEVVALAEQLQSGLPEMFAEHPCVPFYVTFWSLNIIDVDDANIKQSYQSNIAYFERKLPPERRGYHQSVPRKETEEVRRARIEIAKLQMEKLEVTKASTLMQKYLREEMESWFAGFPMMDARSDALHNTLLQDCFLPRSRMSIEDAQYASAMLKFMHDSGVPGFRTIKLLDLLFNHNKLAGIISMYSENEAAMFGRFINGILRELLRWHQNSNDAYTKSAHGLNKELPGFGRRFDADRKPIEHLQYDDFCKLFYKWHKALFNALKSCLESGDFQQIRNSLSILNALFGTFPKTKTMAADLEAIVKHMAQHDERGDVKISATSSLYLFLESRTALQSEYKFRNLPEPPKPAAEETGKTEDEKANTLQAQDSASAKLSATAPAFKPKTETNGVHRQPADRLDDNTTSTAALDRETVKPAPKPYDHRMQNAQSDKDTFRHSNTAGPAAHSSSVPPRPEDRNTPQPSAGRPAHNLPVRPDSQPGRLRHSDRPGVERPMDPVPHSRYESKGPSSDFGRSDRPGDAARLREASPGRRGRYVSGGRTPERMPPTGDHREWPGRDTREYEDRTMRAPPRDGRLPPVRPVQNWDPRDSRDMRDQRERPDSRGQGGPPSMEPRRMHSSSSLNQEHNHHRRDIPYSHHGPDRVDHGPPRQEPIPTSPTTDGPPVNPARAHLINQAEHGRPNPPRNDRDNRRERGSRPQSPRREDDRHGDERRGDERMHHGHHGRPDFPRDNREERGFVPQQLGGRDRRDDPTMTTPTGPRGGRNDLPPADTSRPMFQNSRPQRGSGYQTQDPNFGRLTQPAESGPPSGPRSKSPLFKKRKPNLTKVKKGDRPHSQHSSGPPSGPAGSLQPGIHPSRVDNIQRPQQGQPLQTNMPNAPSGPRGSGRGPQGPPLSSPVNHRAPTGPATIERGQRGNDRRNPMNAITNVLAQNNPSERPNDRSASSGQNPPVRGRGSIRANGPMDSGDMSSPMPPPLHNSTPNARSEGLHSRSSRSEHSSSRAEGLLQDDGKSESRSHRDSRRSERSGHEERSHRRQEDGSSRNGSTDRPPRVEGEERERSGREKRGSEREGSSRRERGDGSERSNRENREPRDSSRRERGSRDDTRPSGHNDRDRRSRGGAGSTGSTGEDGRKRGRDPQDQGQPHGDTKRRR